MKGCRLAVAFVLLFVAGGCAGVKEGSRGFRGVSTKALKTSASPTVAKKFKLEYAPCVEKTRTILNDIGSYIYKDDPARKLIAVYVSQTDTTPVGLFFEALDGRTTQIVFTSQSDYARDYIAGKVEAGLNQK